MVKIVGQETVRISTEDSGILIDPVIVVKGEDGKDGRDGIDGRQGEMGLPGKDGRDGVDGKDGKDGKDGTSFWIEYDKKSNTLIFKNDGGKKNPEPIKLPPTAKGWGFSAGVGRGGGVTAQSDWNQTDKNAVDYIKNKPVIHNVSWKVVQTLPPIGNTWTIYLVPNGEELGSNIYTEWIWVEDEQTQTLYWEQLGEEIDLSGYATEQWVENKNYAQVIIRRFS